ncbi:hypothetical protein WJX74_009621 [Apatococcus lobatus]|uniref:Caffeoyl-CoA O-methyltransferase n=2 Tax=Apatococcus TaxID=904362 RepID=A0AAW1S8H9_9CHLO
MFGPLAGRVHLPGLSRTWHPGRATRLTAQIRCCSSRPEPALGPAKAAAHSAILQRYIEDHNTEQQVISKLRAETKKAFPKNGARLMVTVEQSTFLTWLVSSLQVKQAVEVGTFTGLSALAIAQALPEDGRLVTCEIDARPAALAAQAWTEAGVAPKVDLRMGPAAETLDKLLAAGECEAFDFAFLDGNKRMYWDYFQQLLRLVRPGGVIVADNVLWYGRVADAEDQDKRTIALRDFNDRLVACTAVTTSIVPIGDGLALCRKL